MNTVNAIVSPVVAAILAPFASAPLLGLVVTGFLFGVIATVCFRYCSNQAALRRVSDRTRASLLAVWLFGDDVGVGFRAQGRLLIAAAARLWHSIPPLLVMIVPFALLLTHMAMYYEFRPFTPEETVRTRAALVSVTLAPGAAGDFASAEIDNLPAGLRVDARVVDVEQHRLVWRIHAEQATGPAQVSLTVAPGQTIQKSICVSDSPGRLVRVSPLRPGTSFWDRLLYPAEPGFDGKTAIQEIRVAYPTRSTPVFGVNVPWWLTFLLASFVGAFAVKPLLGVHF